MESQNHQSHHFLNVKISFVEKAIKKFQDILFRMLKSFTKLLTKHGTSLKYALSMFEFAFNFNIFTKTSLSKPI